MGKDYLLAGQMQAKAPLVTRSWRSPASLLLIALFVSLPFETILTGSRNAAFTMSRGIGLALGVAFLLTPRLWRAGRGWALGLFVANLVIAALSVGFSLKVGFLASGQLVQEGLTLCQLCIVFWIASSLLKRGELAAIAWRGFYLSCGVLAGLNWFGMFKTEEVIFGHRESALGQDPNYFAGTLAIGLLTMWHDYLALRMRRRTGAGAPYAMAVGGLSILMASAIIRTGSRNAVLGVLLGATVIAVSSGKRISKTKKILMVTGLACAGWWAVSQGSILEERFKWLEQFHASEARYDIYPIAIEMVREKPLLGWGVASARWELGTRLGHDGMVEAHNLILGSLIDNGFIGSLPLMLAIIICARQAWLARETSRGQLPISLVATMLLMNMFVSWYYMKLFWLIMAYAWSSDVGLVGTESRHVRQIVAGQPSRLP